MRVSYNVPLCVVSPDNEGNGIIVDVKEKPRCAAFTPREFFRTSGTPAIGAAIQTRSSGRCVADGRAFACFPNDKEPVSP